ncbi:helix-turn-helix domain-containing protein [Ferruginibacter sp. SUN106]|uniref:helix-turn-helix domain-containing protein n=1 Tax=Ferruginibacter sp. SUN106 TaxID=2978348 RepID=UPI003D3671EC
MATAGAKIKKLREIRNYSQSYMAAKLGISQTQYSYLENKQKHIPDEDIKTIIALLDITAAYFENFEPALIIEDGTSIKEKLLLQDFTGKNNSSEKEAYLDLIARLKEELTELKKQISFLKSNQK